MSSRRILAIGAAAAVAAVLLIAGCSSDKKSSDSTTTTVGPIGGNVLPPVVLSSTNNTASVTVGTVVTFDMGIPQSGGTFVAVSDNTKVLAVDSIGRTEGGTTYNAGGKALSVGVAKVAVSFHGSTSGIGTPVVFTVTVTAK